MQKSSIPYKLVPDSSGGFGRCVISYSRRHSSKKCIRSSEAQRSNVSLSLLTTAIGLVSPIFFWKRLHLQLPPLNRWHSTQYMITMRYHSPYVGRDWYLLFLFVFFFVQFLSPIFLRILLHLLFCPLNRWHSTQNMLTMQYLTPYIVSDRRFLQSFFLYLQFLFPSSCECLLSVYGVSICLRFLKLLQGVLRVLVEFVDTAF